MATTLLPFLYQTRTLLRAGARLPRVTLTVTPRSRPLHTCHRLARQPRDDDLENVPFLWDEKSEQAYKDELAAKSGKRYRYTDDDARGEDAVSSTITPAEERTFREIFTNIARGSVARAASVTLANPEETKKTQLRILDILRDAAGEGVRKTGSSAAADERHTIHLDTDAESIPEWMMKYPPSLRRSARAAFDPLGASRRRTQSVRGEEELEQEQEQEEHVDPEATQPSAEHQAIRDQAVQRMDALLRACRTDFEVWDLLEREVFSMTKRLGIMDPGSQHESTEPPAAPENDAPQSASATPELSIEIHGPLYSVHLLQSLRTLDGGFSRPSPLALSMLPRIRELGLASYVLGASTPFYNELCAIMWRRHGDVRGVIALLREMMYVGLSFDQDTLDLVHEMETALDAMGQDGARPFSKVLATMPDYSIDVQSQLAKLANKVEAAVRLR
ncbi:hypothetical protein SODALDRAFT_333552 [Sodiomyces alkalinus F11]|uniref:Mtf2-like C-terminal domain-containing protein n=1 Tax=Sodiomyces alkalinus (strain CBS 110278 / VKM F-3762 / F11) TaxID=1314773 RepID=A0A3N2PU01_SODAK|nr:hypothetical protein SODALDRAFT_333552 [Sodiomyces alkalinus F11]ROT37796.1 hypothetical protein SODALDRAFT_333552 [Sodiomyces alkalinus F11]